MSFVRLDVVRQQHTVLHVVTFVHPGVINAKTPTCLLLNPSGDFKAFGYAARDCYHDLDKEEAKNWLFFDKFKMLLHHSQV